MPEYLFLPVTYAQLSGRLTARPPREITMKLARKSPLNMHHGAQQARIGSHKNPIRYIWNPVGGI